MNDRAATRSGGCAGHALAGARCASASDWELHFVTLVLIVTSSLAFIVGGQPQGAGSLNPTESLALVAAQGDQFKQLILMAIYSCFGALFLFRIQPAMFLHAGLPLLVLTAWCLASVLWSINPEVTIRRASAVLGTLTVGTYLGLRFDLEDMLSVLSRVALFVLAASLVLAVAVPHLGLDFEGRLRGVFPHKNYIGSFAALSFVVSVCRLQRRGNTQAVLATSTTVLILSLVAMALAKSTANIPVLSAALAALILARGLRRASADTIALLPLAIPLVLLAGWWAAANAGAIAEMLGKDSDISGRTLVWAFAHKMIMERPWVGYGFGAFWVGGNSPGAVFWANTHLGVPHAHNGYLQLALDGGLISLALFGSSIAVTTVRFAWLQQFTRDPLLVFSAAFVSFHLVTNLSEGVLWCGNETLPLLVVYVTVRTNVDYRRFAAQAAGSGIWPEDRSRSARWRRKPATMETVGGADIGREQSDPKSAMRYRAADSAV